MKTKILVSSIALASTFAAAENYQIDAVAGFAASDNSDAFFVGGRYHFNGYNTNGHPRAEAAFLEKSSNLRASYTDAEGVDVTTINAEIYLENSFYLAPMYAKADAAGNDRDSVAAALGWLPTEGMLLTTLVPEGGYDLNLQMKYVTELGGNNFNFEAGYAEGGDNRSDTTSVAADYYLDRTFSVGIGMANYDSDTDWVLRTTKFINESFGVQASYTSTDSDDTFTISLNASF